MEWEDKLRIMNAIRIGFRQSKLFAEVMNNSVSDDVKGVRGGKMYECVKCHVAFLRKDVQVDHIHPVVLKGFPKREMEIGDFIDRTYCWVNNLQVLCKPCHQNKTNQ